MKKTLFAALAVLFVFAISANVFAEVKYPSLQAITLQNLLRIQVAIKSPLLAIIQTKCFWRF